MSLTVTEKWKLEAALENAIECDSYGDAEINHEAIYDVVDEIITARAATPPPRRRR